MRKLLIKLMSCCMVALMASCGNSETTEETTTTDTAALAENEQRQKMDIIDIQKMAACKCATPLCASTADACGDNCINAVLRCHSIDSQVFARMIANFNFPGKSIDTAIIRAKLEQPGVDCAISWVSVESAFDPADSNNNDIELDVEEVASLIAEKRELVKYRIPLFKGVMAKKPARVLFFKAQKKDCDSNVVNDILFKLEFDNDTATEYYDLSDIPTR